MVLLPLIRSFCDAHHHAASTSVMDRGKKSARPHHAVHPRTNGHTHGERPPLPCTNGIAARLQFHVKPSESQIVPVTTHSQIHS